MVEAALVKLLTSSTAVSAIIGDRIHIDSNPQPSHRPKVTYARLNTARELSNDGPDNSPGAQFRLDCWADTGEQAACLSDIVRNAIDGYTGSVTVGTGQTARTHTIDGIHVRNQYSNTPAIKVQGAEVGPQRYSLTVVIHSKD